MVRRTKKMHKALHECAKSKRVVPNGIDLWTEVRNKLFASTVPAVWEAGFDVPFDKKQTNDGVEITLDRAYADAGHVVVGFAVDGLVGRLHRDFSVEANLYNEKSMQLAKVSGHGISWGHERPSIPEGSWAEVIVFEIPHEIEVTGRQRFRFELKVHRLLPGTDGERSRESFQGPSTGPFIFEFEVDVNVVYTLEVGQRVEAKGISLLLDRVENSPVRTRVFLYFDPPDGEHDWMPVVRTGALGRLVGQGRLAEIRAAEDTGCSTFTFEEPLYNRPGNYALTVTEILGVPYIREKPRRIFGPWNFRFRVPRSQ